MDTFTQARETFDRHVAKFRDASGALPFALEAKFRHTGEVCEITDLILAGEPGFTAHEALVFRLCASDYHHYCYIDDGVQGPNHYIEGQLHSVQPIVLEHYPVFTLNRRSWCLLQTEHFGPVIQTEIGALVVGGIVNAPEGPMRRGGEKGYFDLCGSTIILLLEKDRVRLIPSLADVLDTEQERRVIQGQWVATGVDAQ